MHSLLLVSCIWAFSFPLIKGNLAGVDPSLVAVLRLGISSIVFLPFTRVRGVGSKLIAQMLALGGIQFGLMYVAYISAFRYLPAHTIVLLTTTTPLFVVIIDDLFQRRFRVLCLVAAAMAVAAGGVIQYPAGSLQARVGGIALMQISNAAFALGQVWYRRLPIPDTTPPYTVFSWLYLGATCCASLFLLFSAVSGAGGAGRGISPTQWATLLFLGSVSSGLCFFLWNSGARRVGPAALAVMNNLKIPLGVGASLVLLGEQTDYVRLGAGSVLFLASVAVAHRSASVPVTTRRA